MKKILLIVFALILATTGIVYAIQNKEQTREGDSIMNKKVLIAYFSWSGNTKFIAEKIHKNIGGDLFEIEPITPYPKNYNETAYGIAKEQKEKGIHPDLKNNGNTNDYDVIFVGTPAWWYTMAPPVMTFLENNNFEGKTLIPFITHGGGGKYNIKEDMEKLAKGAKVLNPIVIYERGDSKTDNEIANWLNELKI